MNTQQILHVIKRITAIYILILFFGLLLNCSGSLSPSETVLDFFKAQQNGDFEKASTYMKDAGSYLSRYLSMPDEEIEEQRKRNRESQMEIKIIDEKIEGFKAEVKFQIQKPNGRVKEDTATLVQIEGEWKLNR